MNKKISLYVGLLLVVIVAVFGIVFYDKFNKEYKYAISLPKYEKELDPDLVKSFKEYWELFEKGEYDETYEYELPYQKFLHSKKWYKNFMLGSKKHLKFAISKIKIDPENKNIVYIYIKFHNKYKKFTQRDKWIKVDGIWYHKFIDTILPSLDY